MSDNCRELAIRRFATATAMLEDAIEVAVSELLPWLDRSQLADAGRRVQAAGRDIALIAEAAANVADLGVDRDRNRRKSGP